MKTYMQIIFHPMRYIKWWHLSLAIVLLVPISLNALKANSERMGELKLAVIEADERNENIAGALLELETFVRSHMNTSTRVELVEEYARDVRQAQEKAAVSNGNQKLYDQAVAQCNVAGVPGVQRATCVQNYISERTSESSNPEPVDLPESSLYKFDFVSPRWSFDLAGISVALTVISFGLLAAKFAHKAVQ